MAKCGNASGRVDHLHSCGKLTVKNEDRGLRIEDRMKNAIFYPPSSTLDLLISCWLLLRIASPCSARRAENAVFRASGGRKKWADKAAVDSQTSFWRELESASTNRLKLCGQRSHCYGAVTIIRPRFSICWMAPLDRYGNARNRALALARDRLLTRAAPYLCLAMAMCGPLGA